MSVKASKARESIPDVILLKLPAIHREMFTALFFPFKLGTSGKKIILMLLVLQNWSPAEQINSLQ